MTWDEAKALLREGKRVRRAVWRPGYHLCMRGNGRLFLINPELYVSQYTSPVADQQAADWQEFER